MTTRKTNPAFMTGVPELLVLRLLSRRERYGYEIVRDIRIVSEDAFRFAEGVVYPLLHSMESRGLVKAREKQVNGRSRVYYTLTRKGQLRLGSLAQEWERIKQGLDNVLGGKHEQA